jgi:OmcA/MtrC family decaheme c-type cytochrome
VVQVSPSTPASTISTNASTPTSASVQAWRALEPKITVTGVTINSPPVVSFAVTDANGAAVVGLGNQSKTSTARLKSLTNLSFTLAKLVPATASEPSKWVSYLVTKPTTVAQAAGTIADIPATESCTPDLQWCGTYPTSDKEGTLVDNGDGTYKYTFARDIKKMAAIVATLPVSGDALKKKEDLGDVSYDPSLTHRVGIIISGAAPGTGTNVPNATQVVNSVNIAIPGNYVYDFRPDGGAVTSTRSVVDIASCASCHNGKGIGHSGSRKDPNLCVTCHTDQVRYSMSGEATRNATDAKTLIGTVLNTTSVLDGRAIGNFPNLVHKIHMGDKLGLKGYNYKIDPVGQFEKNEWIQDPRNCTKCHNGSYDPTTGITDPAALAAANLDKLNVAKITKDGDNWKTKPNRLACGACHDDLSFTEPEAVAGTGLTANGLVSHPGGPATDDSSCATCHAFGGTPIAAIDVAHRAELKTVNNPTVIDGVASISYEIKSVTVASDKPSIKFRILMTDGTPIKTFNTTGTQPIAGFSGGPALYVAFAVPQDGITAPADFNASVSAKLAEFLVGTKATISSATTPGAVGTVTTADPDGYFTVTFNSAIPSTAKLVTGAMIGTFTQRSFSVNSLTAKYGSINPTTGAFVSGSVSSGLVIKTPLKKLEANSKDARRVVVVTEKCESCHEQLGTAVDFHGGARNDATACAICHNTSKTSDGWSANASTFIHAIHAGTNPDSVLAINKRTTVTVPPCATATACPDGVPGSGGGGASTNSKSATPYSWGKRIVPFSWARDKLPAVAGGFNAAGVSYPGILKRCDNCHVPNAVNFGADASTLVPNLLWSTSASGTLLTDAADDKRKMPRSPVDGSLMYGLVYGGAYGAGLTVSGATVSQAAGTTLVESPVTAACFACHDNSVAKLHFAANGGVFYSARSVNGGATLVNKETCLVCHGYGRDQDAALVHAK